MASWVKSADRSRWMSELTAGNPATAMVALAKVVLGRAVSAVSTIWRARVIACAL